MLRRSVFAMLLGAVALTGCTSAAEPGAASMDAASQARTLWQDRTEYVGDNSKVIALAEDAGFGAMGAHTLSLQTATTPYAVTVNYSALDKPFETVDFTRPATLLLGTIGNLDRIEVTSDGDSFTLTSAEASAELGYDVKELGRDEARLVAYFAAVDD